MPKTSSRIENEVLRKNQAVPVSGILISLVSIDASESLGWNRTVGCGASHPRVGLLVVRLDALGRGLDGLIAGVPVCGAHLGSRLLWY